MNYYIHAAITDDLYVWIADKSSSWLGYAGY